MPLVQARKAQDFHNSIDTNTHLNYPQYGDFTAVKNALLDIGIMHIRDGCKEISKFKELGNAGIKILYIVAPWINGIVPNMSYGCLDLPKGVGKTLITDILKQIGTQYIRAVEMPNEIDLFTPHFIWSESDRTVLSQDRNSKYWWGHWIHQYTIDARNLMKSDSATANLPIVGASPGRTYTYDGYNPMKPLGDLIEFGNGHYYEQGGNGFQGGKNYAGLSNYFLHGVFPGNSAGRKLGSANLGEGEAGNSALFRECSERPYGGKPMMITECGSHTGYSPQALSYAMQAKFLTRMFVEYFRLGFVGSYSYEFIDKGSYPEGQGDREDTFGILTNSLAYKPAAVQLKALISAIKESSVDTRAKADSLDYTLNYTMPSGYSETAFVKQVLLQKADGTFILLAYHNIAIANCNTGNKPSIPLSHPPIKATLNLLGSYSIKATTLGTTTAYPTSNTTTTSAFSFDLTDNITILEIKPIAATTPPPSPVTPAPVPTPPPAPTPTAPAPDLGLTTKNIGNATGSFTVTGVSLVGKSKGSGYGGTSDAITIRGKTTSGVNASIEAKCSKPTGNATAKSGIMFRQDTDPKAQFYSLGLKADGGIIERYRSVYGQESVSKFYGNNTVLAQFRINKVGNNYQGQYKVSATDPWTNCTTQTMKLGDRPEHCVFISSSSTTIESSGTISDVKLG